MATSTFDRRLEIKDEKDLDRLADFLSKTPSSSSFSNHPYDENEEKRGERLLNRWLSNSR